ncbi:MAG: trigger factor [Clostridia bacterium]|nr:trigger factor [Clostridia bacterium]
MIFSAKTVKQLAALALALLMGTSLLACGGEEAKSPQTTDPNENKEITQTPDAETTAPTDETVVSFNYLEEDLTPYITLGNYREITVKRQSSVLSDDIFADYLEEVREYCAEPQQITDRAAAEGDTVNFDFAGYVDGVQFDGGTAQGQSITLTGNGGFIEGFVPAIIGKTPGESFDIVTSFPEDYGVDELNGKEATFKCTLNYIEGEKIVPEFDDALAQKISDFETAEELKVYLREQLQAEMESSASNQIYHDVWEQVVNNATIHSYPEDKVTEVYNQNVSTYTMYGAMYGMSYEEFLAAQNYTDAQVLEEARQMVKEDLIFYSIVKAENITISDEEYNATLPEFAAYYDYTDPQELVDAYGEVSIRDGMLWNKTQDLLIEWANIVEAE